MANMLPQTPLQGSTSEVIRLFNALRRLPEDVYIFQRLPALHGPGPDFWILSRQRVLFISVCTAVAKDIRQREQMSLFAAESNPVAQQESQHTAEFLSILESLPELPAVVCFPNVTDKQLQQTATTDEDKYPWIGKSRLGPVDIQKWLETYLSKPLPKNQIIEVRRRFTPEVLVPVPFTVRQRPDRQLDAELTPYLLDYSQEWAMKMDLNLLAAGQTVAKDFQLRLINGVAGSGKSLIVLYRAHLLRQLYPGKRILVLTHNRALNSDLRRRYQILEGTKPVDNQSSVRFYTFMGWCRRYWPKNKEWRNLISHRKRTELVSRIWHEHLADTAMSSMMLLEEIDWYKDRLLFGEADYLAADRTGRGFGLAASMRQRVFAAMEVYHQELQKQRLMDWGDVPRQVWRLMENGEIDWPQYDVVLIDEAQFFAPLWFEIIKKIIRSQNSHLFLVADPSQGFLKRGQSWLASGLEVRGRVHRLNRSYRTTREILDFATLLYRERLPHDDEDIVVPDMSHMPAGVYPVVVPVTSEQDELTRVVNEIRELHEKGVALADILVIHASWETVGTIIGRLEQTLGPNTAVNPAKDEVNDCIRVCSLNAVTGLESPIVFLMGVHDLYEKEQSIRLSPEERADLVRDNTRKLYMAITRAGQRLVLTYVGNLPTIFANASQSAQTDNAEIVHRS